MMKENTAPFFHDGFDIITFLFRRFLRRQIHRRMLQPGTLHAQ
jgi:hypothetical protein